MISEIGNQYGHAAAAGVGKTQYLLQLREFVIGLALVGFPPVVFAAGNILGEVHNSAAVDP